VLATAAVQLVGRPGDELALLATAARIEGREVPDARRTQPGS